MRVILAVKEAGGGGIKLSHVQMQEVPALTLFLQFLTNCLSLYSQKKQFPSSMLIFGHKSCFLVPMLSNLLKIKNKCLLIVGVYEEGLQKARKKSLSRQQWHQFWPKQKYIKVMVGHAKRGETGDDLSHLFCDKRVVSSQHLILASHLCT